MKYENDMLKIKKIVEEGNFIQSNPYVVGVGVGNKIIKGTITDIPCLTFLVVKKIPEENINRQYIIPRYIYEIVTDVIEIGKVSTQGDTPKKRQLALGGMAIQNVKNKRYGTIGYAVTDRKTKKELYILSCNTIVTDGETDELTDKSEIKVLFPNIANGGTLPKGVIGLTKKIIKLKPGLTLDDKLQNEVDAGLVYVGRNDRQIKTEVLAPYVSDRGNTPIVGITPVKEKDEIWRVGAETGKGAGPVISAAMKIQRQINGKDYIFKNQIMVEMKSKDGDSGALGAMMEGNKAFGLQMFASRTESGQYTYFNPIDRVLKLLDVEIVTAPF